MDVLKQAGKHMEISTFWKVVGPHFCRNHSSSDTLASERIRTSIIPDLPDNETSKYYVYDKLFFKLIYPRNQ